MPWPAFPAAIFILAHTACSACRCKMGLRPFAFILWYVCVSVCVIFYVADERERQTRRCPCKATPESPLVVLPLVSHLME